MKNFRLIIYIVVIITIFCSPVLAISSSDLIAQYRGQSAPTIPPVIPTTTPTTTPTITTSDKNPLSALSVTSEPTGAMVFLDGSFKGFTPIYIDGLSVGTTHQLRVLREGYEAYSTDVLIKNPEYCYMIWYLGREVGVCDIQKANHFHVTLKKAESTQKPTIPTIAPTTIPTWTPTPIPTKLMPTTTPTPITTSDENNCDYRCTAALLSVTSTPTQAMVIIDGSFKGLTPITIHGLSVGTHQLKVSFPTYEDYSTEILIPPPRCHVPSDGLLYGEVVSIPIDVTLKKIEYTQKRTIPTFVRPTSPTTIPTTPISMGTQNGDPVLRLFLREHPDINIRFRQPTDVSD